MPPAIASIIRSRALSSMTRKSSSPICANVSPLPAQVDAIGLDNQGESCLAWDNATGEPLSPVIVWQDDRTTDVIERAGRRAAKR